jgi:carboxynorspermidine decarboxylase
MPDDATARSVSKLVPETPALVFAESELVQTATRIRNMTAEAGCDLVYAAKPCTLAWVLNTISPYVTGFAASSPFEARLARQILGDDGNIHYHAVAVTESEFEEVSELADFVSLNSINQFRTHQPQANGNISIGLRANPGISFVADERYDPCRRHSKLGVPIDALSKFDNSNLNGLMFHTNCESDDLRHLLATVTNMDNRLSPMLDNLDWINLGGGYMFREGTDISPLQQAVEIIKSHSDTKIIIEPGAAFVRDAGYIVSTVLDIFDSNGVEVAVLDTTVNHMPEVFEYQFEPEVLDYDLEGQYRYILAGRSCLAGDIFGDYTFEQPLKIGDRITFTEMGAYTQPKAHTFNGINLPNVYAYTQAGELSLIASMDYENFAARNGVQQLAYS